MSNNKKSELVGIFDTKKPIFSIKMYTIIIIYILVTLAVFAIFSFVYDKDIEAVGFLLAALGFLVPIIALYQSNYTTIRMKKIEIVIENENENVDKDILNEAIALTDSNKEKFDYYYNKVLGILEVLISYEVDEVELKSAKKHLDINKNLESLKKIATILLIRSAYIKSAALKTVDSQSPEERQCIEQDYFTKIKVLFNL
ncbi:hypothetical protein [Lactococcus lactis]|uniref:hypothetical protein n=1 Tax=Lactococcus lactis TaxID=1358 RepID=UPI003A801630